MSATRNLPLPATPFVGRAAELAAIAALLADPACRLLTLLGPGGIGKTRLAIQATADSIPAFADGAAFVALAPLRAQDDLVTAIASAVGFQFYAGEDPRHQLLDYFRAKHLLLVLDNFEHLLAQAGLVADLLHAAPRLTILTTSREALKLQEEWVRPVEGMAFPVEDARHHAAALDQYGALRLFETRARQARADFSLAEEWAGALRICRLVGGMPLAVELAAAWAAVLSCDAIADEIGRSLDFLTASARNVPDRHRSIRAVFESSWERLTPDEQASLRRMSIFRGGFDRAGAAAVAGANLPHLLALADKSLIARRPDGRFESHELLRQLAEEKLAADPADLAETRVRFVAHYADFLAGAVPDLQGRDQIGALRAIEAEIDNVRGAWMLAVSRRHLPTLERLLSGLTLFYLMRSRLNEAVEMFGGTLDYLATLDLSPQESVLVAQIKVLQAFTLNRLLRYPEAMALYREAAPVLRALDDPASGTPYVLLGSVVIWAGADRQTATEWARRALAIFEAHDDRWGMGLALRALGECFHDGTRYGEAHRLFSQALELARATGDHWNEANALNSLGEVAYTLGDYPEAIRLYNEGLTVLELLNIPYDAAWTRCSLAGLYIILGNYAAAEAGFRVALDFAQRIGSRGMASFQWMGLGEAALYQGRYDEAARYLETSLAGHGPNSFKDGTGWVHVAQSRLRLERGDPAGALALARQTLDEMHQIGNPWGVSSAYYMQGRALLALEGPAAARTPLMHALRGGIAQRSVMLLARYLVGVGEWLAAQGDVERALETLGVTLHAQASWDESRQSAARLRDRLAADLPAGVVDAALQRGADTEVLAAAADLLRSYGEDVAPPTPPAAPLAASALLVDALTERELEILQLIEAGLSNPEIAARLVVGLSTVKKHINHVYSKLNVTSRTQALARARELGIL